ncbi:MAG TPA: carbohydrate binding domain-containing protein [Candidatus Saccharimonadales bacterium]|nr:carbohydrate binding domain-containing protein [Candidatus Saccharimonadales bacterium]
MDQENPLSNPESSLMYDAEPANTPTSSVKSDEFIFERKKSAKTVLKILFVGFMLLAIFAAIFLLFSRQSRTQMQVGNFNEIHLPLTEIAAHSTLANADGLKVRGQLEVSGALTLAPSTQPQNPVSGQLYFDKDRKQMQYYDGTQFILLQGGTGATITTISNISTGGSTSTVTNNVFNTTSGGLTLSGTPGSLAMFTGSDSLGDSLIQQTGTNLQVASNSTSTVTVGSAADNSATVIQGGTGNVALSTGSSSGVTGSISITTGDSSTTASGNISIDSGAGIIDGEVIEDKTFEDGLDNMQDWFNTSLATTTAQAHSGSQSLQVTPSSSFWGVIEIFPGTAVTPGHQYHFSIWVRASTTPRTIGASVVWQGAGPGVITAFAPVVDSATGWTEMTLTAPAPAGATSVAFRMQSSTGAAGDIHYFDDVSITDLSSSTAISAINIGSTNAKIITIGNLNQIGATTINGGSGVSIQSGAATTTINGGALSMTGNAASSLTTTGGTLTIASATTASWGISTASSGVGGSLTLHAGQGGSDGNNDGGDVILQGGARNGTGSPGSVIVKPPSDVADAFQLQNSAGTAFLVADSTTKAISISGTSSSFAALLLANAHFGSTQTTPPTISVPSSCGTSPTAAVTAGSTDTAGSFTITTGTGGTAATCDATITFNQVYGGAPKSIIVVGKTDAASVGRQIYVSNNSTSSFTTAFGVSAGGANSTTYSFSYWVVE